MAASLAFMATSLAHMAASLADMAASLAHLATFFDHIAASFADMAASLPHTAASFFHARILNRFTLSVCLLFGSFILTFANICTQAAWRGLAAWARHEESPA